MTSNRLIAAAMLSVLPLSSCGDAAAPPARRGSRPAGAVPLDPMASARAAPFRIAGVGLMMTPNEVATALAAQGYEEDRESRDSVTWRKPAFEDRVRQRVTGDYDGKVPEVPTLQTYGKGGEHVEVRYGAFPGAQRAVGIGYKAGGPSPSEQDIKSGLEKRYGRGQSPFGTYEDWCSPSSCGPTAAKLTANGQRVDLFAGGGLDGPDADDRRVDAAAHASGQASKGSF